MCYQLSRSKNLASKFENYQIGDQKNQKFVIVSTLWEKIFNVTLERSEKYFKDVKVNSGFYRNLILQFCIKLLGSWSI